MASYEVQTVTKIARLEPRLSVPDFVSQFWRNSKSYKTKPHAVGTDGDHKTFHTFFLSTIPKPQTQITGGCGLLQRCIHGQ